MKNVLKSHGLAAVVLLAIANPARPQTTAPEYTFTTIAVPGASSTDAWGLNNAGDVVGSYVVNGATHGFLLRKGSYTQIDVPGSTFTQATAINDSRIIVGTFRDGSTTMLHGFMLIDGGFLTIDVPNATSSMPRGIGRRGQVVFESIVDGHDTAYVLVNGNFYSVEPPASFAGGPVTLSYASDISRQHVIVGRYDTSGTNYGFVLDDGEYIKIQYPGSSSSTALGINRRGDIVGGYTASGLRHGYLLMDDAYLPFDVPGCVTSPIGGAPACTTPRKINDSRQVVGGYGTDGGNTNGFIATPIRHFGRRGENEDSGR